jgi:hypothetical protein
MPNFKTEYKAAYVTFPITILVTAIGTIQVINHSQN